MTFDLKWLYYCSVPQWRENTCWGAKQERTDISMSPTGEDVLTDIRPYELSTWWWLWGWIHVVCCSGQDGSLMTSKKEAVSPDGVVGMRSLQPLVTLLASWITGISQGEKSKPGLLFQRQFYVPLEWTLQPGGDNHAIDSKCPFNVLRPSAAIPWSPGKLDLPSHCPVFIGLDSANGADGDLNHESLSSQV